MSDTKYCIYKNGQFLAIDSFSPYSDGFRWVNSIAIPGIALNENKDSPYLLELQTKFGGSILSFREAEEKQRIDLAK